ncbi:SRPBCC domain-containing protein [Mucilaginibacter glaciei]|uniref:SRPBCC domain-containing protein n=1 Tax=Mucilaginibacter glaciei TaxID=2772109 RepID=A0A926NWY7_9SPHI|nr:SRPBCC domain-containing protein [Mucilaginibacter glaciei]MBD1393358.1 SRPBCC domain-containing protein [Mucilaginibacter glaciei]
MDTSGKASITAIVDVHAPLETVWAAWNTPGDIMQWNNVTDEWHTPTVENDLRPGARFLYVMGLKDGSFNFNFEGIYDEVKAYELISYTLDDGRKSTITFKAHGETVRVTEVFEPNNSDPIEMQSAFCQAVLHSFKRHVEGNLAKL